MLNTDRGLNYTPFLNSVFKKPVSVNQYLINKAL